MPESITRRAFDSLPSTQAYAVQWVRDGEQRPVRVVATRQTRGQGRAAHTWTSPVGGLYMSSVVPSSSVPDPLASLLVSGAIAGFLRDQFDLALKVKWPNDIVVPQSGGTFQKLGGILLDVLSTPRGDVVVAGVGLNLSTRRTDFPADLGLRVAILRELSNRPINVGQIEEGVDGSLRRAIADIDTYDAREARLAAVRAILYGQGRRAKIDGTIVGTMIGVGPEGELVVRDATGERQFWTGDLIFEAGD